MGYEADFVIVGAGAAGSVLAARLAEDKNNSVIVVEAGPDNSSDEYISIAGNYPLLWDLGGGVGPSPSPSHWRFMIESKEKGGKVYCYPRGTGIGGSTNHHALFDGRGSALIYDDWAKLTGDDFWCYDNMLKYFKKMECNNNPGIDERYHGKDGWLQIKNLKLEPGFHGDLMLTCRDEFGIPIRHELNGDPNSIAGFGWSDMQAYPDGRRSYAGKDLLLPTQKKNKEMGWNNLEILTDRLVTKILFDDKKAIGIEVIEHPRAYQVDVAHQPGAQSAKKIIIKAKKEVILCAGAINTPQILMLSGVGPKAELEKFNIKIIHDSPGVGSHLQDHIECGLIHKVENLPNKYWRWQATLMSKSDPSFLPYSDPESVSGNAGPVTIDWHTGFDGIDMKFPDIHVHGLLFYFRDFNYNPAIHTNPDPIKGAYLKHFIEGIDPKNHVTYHTFLVENMKPYAQGTIRLKSSDPLEPPTVDLNLNEDRDLTRLAMGLMLFREISQAPLMKKYLVEELLPGPKYDTLEKLKEYVATYSSWGHHISGTAKMGTIRDSMAVVDSKLRVIGLEGLRICDASIFPYIPSYNTSRASYLVGEAGADIIKKENR